MKAEELKIPTESASDRIEAVGEKLVGEGHYYVLSNGQFEPRSVRFQINIGTVLMPFRYKKPSIGAGGIFAPDEVWEESLRSGYQLLSIVQHSYRGPCHWHRGDDAMFCAVLIGGVWETRYFPKGNIELFAWDEAVASMQIRRWQ